MMMGSIARFNEFDNGVRTDVACAACNYDFLLGHFLRNVVKSSLGFNSNNMKINGIIDFCKILSRKSGQAVVFSNLSVLSNLFDT